MEQHNQRLGRTGEDAAAQYLASIGHRILDRNWRSKYGELDLVTEFKGQLIAVEVKTRSSENFGTAFEAISASKYRRIQRLLLQWAATRKRYTPVVRVDVVTVSWQNQQWRIEHHLAVGQ